MYRTRRFSVLFFIVVVLSFGCTEVERADPKDPFNRFNNGVSQILSPPTGIILSAPSVVTPGQPFQVTAEIDLADGQRIPNAQNNVNFKLVGAESDLVFNRSLDASDLSSINGNVYANGIGVVLRPGASIEVEASLTGSDGRKITSARVTISSTNDIPDERAVMVFTDGSVSVGSIKPYRIFRWDNTSSRIVDVTGSSTFFVDGAPFTISLGSSSGGLALLKTGVGSFSNAISGESVISANDVIDDRGTTTDTSDDINLGKVQRLAVFKIRVFDRAEPNDVYAYDFAIAVTIGEDGKGGGDLIRIGTSFPSNQAFDGGSVPANSVDFPIFFNTRFFDAEKFKKAGFVSPNGVVSNDRSNNEFLQDLIVPILKDSTDTLERIFDPITNQHYVGWIIRVQYNRNIEDTETQTSDIAGFTLIGDRDDPNDSFPIQGRVVDSPLGDFVPNTSSEAKFFIRVRIPNPSADGPDTNTRQLYNESQFRVFSRPAS